MSLARSVRGLVIAAIGGASLSAGQYVPPAPTQPLPYSHKQHVALGLTCLGCHTMPEPGYAATLPTTATCMSCHSRVKAESESIRMLSAAHERNESIPWQRVYRVPSFVFFSHKQHAVEASLACGTCHGAVQEMDVMQRVGDISMAACMDCHREQAAPIGCDICHDPR